MMQDPFELLNTKEIIALLDGDTEFGYHTLSDGAEIKVSMPYLSGPNICDLSRKLGYPMEYGRGLSRWEYFYDLIDNCIENGDCSKLLHVLFDLTHFQHKLAGCSATEIEYLHNLIVKSVINSINGSLYFSGYELLENNGVYYIKQNNNNGFVVPTPNIEAISRDYVIRLARSALEQIDNNDFESAVTKARSLVEEVFCFVIEKKGESPSSKGDLVKLYNQVKNLYNMHENRDMDRRINELISGLNKIVSAISAMRNKSSDAHGLGAKRIALKEHHVRLYVNASMMLSEFVLSVADKEENT